MGHVVHQVLRTIGILWMGAMVAIGVWLGFDGLFVGRGGILAESGMENIWFLVIGIWILALCGVPGYFLWKWSAREGGAGKLMPKGPKGE